MGAAQARLIGLASASLALIIASALAMDWFVANPGSNMMGANRIGVDLRTIHICTPLGLCAAVPVGLGGGSYTTFASMTLWGALGFAVIVGVQVGRRILNRSPLQPLVKLGYGAAAFVVVNAVVAGYLVNPGLGHQDLGFGVSLHVTRTVAPALLLVASVVGTAALYFAAGRQPAMVQRRVDQSPSISVAEALVGKLRFAASSMDLSAAGIDARFEAGQSVLVRWDAVVGVVVRRLPADPPYAGQPFVDVVSTSGSTLRALPWTRLTGEPLGEVADVLRCRALVQLVVARCPGAHLDRATRDFLMGAQPLQLPDAATLAEHDDRLA
jgi:hypothetical protein